MNKYQNFKQEPSKYNKPFKKKSFEFIKQFIGQPKTLLDIGYGSGDFIFSLDEGITAVGIDKSSDLIKLAKKRNNSKSKSFFQMNVLSSKDNESFKELLDNVGEVVTILGMLHTFIDFRPLLDRVLESKNTKKIFILSPFNDDKIDVRIYHKDLTLDSKKFQSAYNFFSKETIKEYLHNKNINNFKYVPFEMDNVLEKDTKHPSRCWHVITKDGEKFLTNGMKILFKEDVLIINK